MTHEELVADLPLLLTGELGRGQLQEVVDHLRGCAQCRRELVEMSAGHATLAATRRTLAPAVVLPALESVTAEQDSWELPPLDRPIRVEAGGTPSAGRRRILLGAVAAAAVLALALGGVAVTGNWPGHGSTRQVTATRKATLAPVTTVPGTSPTPGASGVVQMSGPADRIDMTIRTAGLPKPAIGHFYYAWLLDPSTNKMLPLGVVDVGSTASFEVATDLVDRYSAVDISLQADNGNPVHSPVSVLRATYA